jgi:hypothetical protein
MPDQYRDCQVFPILALRTKLEIGSGIVIARFALLLSLADVSLVVPALAQQPVQPLAKVGSCPLGYFSSGGDCVPSARRNNREAIQKTGKTCPLGWFSSASYCAKSR